MDLLTGTMSNFSQRSGKTPHLSAIFLKRMALKHCEFNPQAEVNIEILGGADDDIIIHQKVSVEKRSAFKSNLRLPEN